MRLLINGSVKCNLLYSGEKEGAFISKFQRRGGRRPTRLKKRANLERRWRRKECLTKIRKREDGSGKIFPTRGEEGANADSMPGKKVITPIRGERKKRLKKKIKGSTLPDRSNLYNGGEKMRNFTETLPKEEKILTEGESPSS